MVMIAIVALLIMDAAPSIAEDTASAEPAGGTEKTTTARPKALELWAENRALRWHAGWDVEGGW